MTKDKIPTDLTHKPIYGINDYHTIDGNYKTDTDVAGISVGKAQWSQGEVVPSVKVWRKPDKKWSRQSEETTFTRALDMAMLVIRVLDKHYNGKDFEPLNSVFGSIKIENMDCDPSIVKEFNDFLDKHKDDIDEHVKVLYAALQSYMGNK